ncbi:hypothetical protein QCA50_001474 [Cerrena zonata]|uniref:Uncharacterized protein n=1 Tax=Cerrena zonata TaxID=2478898 RepID=A0AAW0GQV0_9APHY
MHFNFNALAYVPAKLKLFWERISSSKITIIYFVFSLVHCVIQIIFQIQAFTINAHAVSFLNGIIASGNSSRPGFAVFGGQDLRWCTSVPKTADATTCPIVWSANTTINESVSGALRTTNGTAAFDNVSTVVSGAVIYDAVSSTPSQSSIQTLAASSAAPVSSLVSSSVASAAPVSSSSAPATTSSTSVIVLSSASTATSAAAVAKASSISTSTSTLTVTANPSASSSLVSLASSSSSSLTPQTVTVVVKPSATATASNNAAHEDDDDDDDDDDDEDDLVKLLLKNSKRHVRVFASTSSDGERQVNIDGLNGLAEEDEITLNQQCLLALTWPVAIVEYTKREDITFILFQVWVLGMSLVAILNESIPHIFASLFTHIVATAWGGFQIWHTGQFRENFLKLTVNGPCHTNLLPSYWKGRAHAEIPSLVLNVVALMISAFLTWRLVKLFGWQTFKRVGASLVIRRIYNAVLVLSIVIQLSAFFIVAVGGLWLDQVWNGQIASMTHKPTAMKAVAVLVILLLFPWLFLGWVSVRREYKKRMLAFLILSFLYLVGWSSMFVARTFRWTFTQWRFFTMMATASVILTAITLALGVYCRINFGKGLTRYLNAHHPLEDDFQPVNGPFFTENNGRDIEKVDFPNTEEIPTFSATLERFGPDAPQPAHMGYAPRVLGPRFFQPASYDSATSFSSVGFAGPAPPYSGGAPPYEPYHQRSLTVSSAHSTLSGGDPSRDGLTRHGSGASQHSISSLSSGNSQPSRTRQRWIIE